MPSKDLREESFAPETALCVGIDGVSIVICCHNGAARIEATLQALANCQANFPVEIILVDNASTDHTKLVACCAWDRIGNADIVFRYISEPQLGLAFARRRGVWEAKYDIVIFCDDDNWLSSDYLLIVAEVFSNPNVGAVGGQIQPVAEGQLPNFVFSHGAALALGIQEFSSGYVSSRPYLWGAGLAMRRSDLLKMYRCPAFPVLTDRTGTSPSCLGNDTELCLAVTILGKKLYYDERLKLRHFLPEARLQIDYLKGVLAGVPSSSRFTRRALGLDAMIRTSRLFTLVKSTLRWIRHYHQPAERDYYAWMVLAACGLTHLMSEEERKLYTSIRSLHSWGTERKPQSLL